MENEQLRQALRSRELIGQATGVLMGQRRCRPETAFTLLVNLSQDTNTKLRDVARAFLNEFLDTLPENSRDTAPSPREPQVQPRFESRN
ncbi:ANTAR domain-containing protein [Amycolatopsis sp. NPDC023774]|uniref:ANTAR domain-containing protein n=1 Tax=Amycolatopsis sp. NPDC023774 TaxID=3155015 RepID=UPI00340ABCFC